jgi:tRNA pseudouridine32 synthase / 23S rRNA pseudouridine746 synthase
MVEYVYCLSMTANMSRSKSPSKVRTPNDVSQWPSALEFLSEKFPSIPKATWLDRMTRELVHWQNGDLITVNSPCLASTHIMYYREVTSEPVIPFDHEVIYQDNEIIVVDKPHFLPVTPGGIYVNECLLNRIRKQFDNEDIVPIHRLDKDTAGLVIFSRNPMSRGCFTQLFANRQIEKSYQAVAQVNSSQSDFGNQKSWEVKNHIKRGNPGFVWTQGAGDVNAYSEIILEDTAQDLGLFRLIPHTGKTHQLRLHMMAIGMPILNDRFYPKILPFEDKLDSETTTSQFSSPLQLLASSLRFTDPLNGFKHVFKTKRHLGHWQVQRF